MPILNCGSCGSVATATFGGADIPDSDNYLIEDIEFTVSLDAHTGAPTVQVDPANASQYQKLNMPYWDQLMVQNIQHGTIDMSCEHCGDDVKYDVRYTQTQAPPQQPTAPGPPPSVGGILAGQIPPAGGIAGGGVTGAPAPPPAPTLPGGLPMPPTVPASTEEDKGSEHDPTTLNLPPEVIKRLKEFEGQTIDPSDGFNPPRRNK